MKLPLDPGDVLGDGCWEAVKRVLVVVSTLWVGAIAALVALFAAQAVELMLSGAWGDLTDLMVEAGRTLIWALLLAPFYFLFSFWGFVLIPLMAVVLYGMCRSDKDVTWVWFASCVIVGVLGMTGVFDLSVGMQSVAWVVFILLVLSLAAGCWFLAGWRRNEQARHLIEVQAENEQRRLELGEKFGTKSFGQGNRDDFQDE